MNLPHTARALEIYDHEQVLLDQQGWAARTEREFDEWLAADRASADRVCEAFYLDCLEQGIPNSRGHCMVVDISTLRAWCKEAK